MAAAHVLRISSDTPISVAVALDDVTSLLWACKRTDKRINCNHVTRPSRPHSCLAHGLLGRRWMSASYATSSMLTTAFKETHHLL